MHFKIENLKWLSSTRDIILSVLKYFGAKSRLESKEIDEKKVFFQHKNLLSEPQINFFDKNRVPRSNWDPKEAVSRTNKKIGKNRPKNLGFNYLCSKIGKNRQK